MARFRSIVALLALGTAAAACGPVGQPLQSANNPSLYSVNQPVVQRTDYVLDLSTSGDGVSAEERDRLASWFESLELGYGDRISVDQGQNYVDARARQDVGTVAAAYGLLLDEGAPLTAGNVQPGSVRVVVSRTTASVPNCPNWGEEVQFGRRAQTSPGYGCATNSNLAAMIADPNDLVLGQTGSGNGAAATGSKAIRTYRSTVPTGTGGLTQQSTGGRQ